MKRGTFFWAPGISINNLSKDLDNLLKTRRLRLGIIYFVNKYTIKCRGGFSLVDIFRAKLILFCLIGSEPELI